MNEGIVERGEDTSNTENLGTVCLLVILFYVLIWSAMDLRSFTRRLSGKLSYGDEVLEVTEKIIKTLANVAFAYELINGLSRFDVTQAKCLLKGFSRFDDLRSEVNEIEINTRGFQYLRL